MMLSRKLLKVALFFADYGLLAGTFLVAYVLRFDLSFLPERPVESFDLYQRLSLLVASLGCGTLYTARMYDLSATFGLDRCFRIVRAMTLSAVILTVTLYTLRGYVSPYDTHLYSRLIIGIFWLLSIVVLTLWRWLFVRFLGQVWSGGRGLQQVLLLGADETAQRIYTAMKVQPALGYFPIGCLTDSDATPELGPAEVLGTLHDLPDLLKTVQLDEVILGIPHLKGELVAMLMNACQRADVKFSMVPSLFEILTSQVRTREVAGIPIFSIDEPLLDTWNRRLKRVIDIVGGIALSLLTFPIWLVSAALIKLESPGPVLFTQKRTGKGEKYFRMFKFRTMGEDAEQLREEMAALNEVDGPIFKIRNDPRVTKLGRFLRRTSIDELPQLINVFRGEMSLVGPRPYPVLESEQFDTFERIRYDALPGITGLAQVSGRSDLSMSEILRLDLYYIENWSIARDLMILIKTIPAILTRKGAY
jgi:exopolysaccharide biosynthesis polyprenyl glycosylphosphotransferase